MLFNVLSRKVFLILSKILHVFLFYFVIRVKYIEFSLRLVNMQVLSFTSGKLQNSHK